jgi:hypothetical protein
MKKLLLIVLLMSFLAASAQLDKNSMRKLSPHAPVSAYYDNGTPSVASFDQALNSPLTATPFTGNRDINSVNPFQIGSSANAFGFAFSRTTYLWADNNINSVAFMHRMTATPGSGYLAYDLSTAGGAQGTWTNNVQTYNGAAPNPGARYPQGTIYNPPGNTNPDNAYYHYFAPTLDGSNTSGTLTWGGYAYGVKNLAGGSTPTQHNRPSADPYWQFLPSAFTMTQLGDTWMVDECTKGIGAEEYEYQGSMIVGHGTWNPDINDFDYLFDLFPLEIHPDAGFNDIKIAFAPDGLTGYICVMTELPEQLPFTNYHPVLFKTTDGGETWSDPIEVQLGGEYGLPEILNYISDERLEVFYDPDPVPARDEIMYWMGYEVDMAVDAWGNPHLSGTVTIADAEGIWTGPGLTAMFHIWSDDGGLTWDAHNLAYLNRFSKEFTGGGSTIAQYNRPQVATTMDGNIVFFSWLDTDDTTIADNGRPDIYFREYLPSKNEHGEDSINVTYFSAGMWNAFYGCMSHYVFSEIATEDDLIYNCTIPFVYEQLTSSDPTLEVKFFYIPDFVQTYVLSGVGLDEKNKALSIDVLQNYPNPFRNASTVRVYLPFKSDLKLVVTNMLGQQVMEINNGEVGVGSHQFLIDGSQLDNGIYFYTVTAGKESVTKKMVVR